MTKRPSKARLNWAIRKAEDRDVDSLLSLSRSVTDTCSREFLDDAAVDDLPHRWVAAHPQYRLEQREEESREGQARGCKKCATRRVAVMA